ncbi:MAG: 50S ribosomal protein L9 [Chloroherpetonaceae bacterium]|nr:50S ribosomal protein L9 [Chloroherpetonaceae bacterium]
MKVILKKAIEKLGEQGEVVTVKDGYARNYLIPLGMASRATEGLLVALENEKKQKSFKIERERKTARELAASISHVTLTVKAKAGEGGKLYGTVTNQMLADALKVKGFEIDRRNIEVEHVKSLGNHTAKVKLYNDVFAEVQVSVEAE